MTEVPPVPGPPQHGVPAGPVRRPPAVVAAVVLMAPAAVTWLVAGVGFLVATARTKGDGPGMSLLWVLAVAILALCLLVAYMAVVGMVQAWRGTSTRIRIPAGFTVLLFCLALINLLVHRRLSYTPTQLVPLVVGAMAGVAFRLVKSKSAAAWFTQLH